jgi:ABC-type branched-subunit amino acid transport system permease subunit
LLFLVASGLTLIFGIMGVINLAHGSFYMIGAYMAYALAPVVAATTDGGFFATMAVGVVLSVMLGYLLEWAFFSFLYEREHLQQVLMTYGLILVFEEFPSLIVGDDVHGVKAPEILAGTIPLGEVMTYPVYRLFISAVCLLLSPDGEGGHLALLLGACVGLAALYALAVGSLSLRTRGVYFIMVTLAFAQMAYYVIHDTPLGGGTDGIYLNARPALGDAFALDGARTIYFFTLACLALVFGFLALLLRSRFGRALAGIRVNEQRMRATGFTTYPYKLAAFTISGALAGLAGFLFAVKDGFVNPELLSWHLSGAVLIMIILGGIGHLRGALIGAFAYVLLQEFFESEAGVRRLRQALAPRARLHDHRQRGAADARAGGHPRPAARAPRSGCAPAGDGR